MGSGKSTVGRALAKKLRYQFIDMDALIEEQAGKSISEIFAGDGEPEFRRRESETIEEFLSLERTVVSMGGGAYAPRENRLRVRQAGITVWIDCPIDLCLSRAVKETNRPLLGSYPVMVALYRKRLPSYRQVDFVVHTESHSPLRIASEIVRMLGLS